MGYQVENDFIYPICLDLLAKYQPTIKPAGITKAKLDKYDVVTAVDEEINDLLTAAIKTRYPEDIILAEETAQTEKVSYTGRVWVIDPICGTTNLARGLPYYVTNLILINNGKAVAAWVVNYAQDIIVSSVGAGLLVNNQAFTPYRPDGRLLIDIDSGFAEHKGEKGKKYFSLRALISLDKRFDLRITGSSFSFVMVATGHLQAAMVYGAKPWDVLAGAFLAVQSGGVCVNFAGNNYSLNDSDLIFAQTQEIADIVLSFVKDAIK